MLQDLKNLNRLKAEQILEKHLSLMLSRTDQSYVSIDEMKQQPEWQATINAMLEYGEMQTLHSNVASEYSSCVECEELFHNPMKDRTGQTKCGYCSQPVD